MNLCTEIVNGAPAPLAHVMMKIPQVRKCVQVLILENIDEQCKKLTVKTKGKPSVLRVSREDHKNLTSFPWMNILEEMQTRAPDILDILVTIGVPKPTDDGKQADPQYSF